MQLLFVTGLAHGKAQTYEGDKPPEVVRVETDLVDGELGVLFIKYRLVYWDKKEAYYVPFSWETGFSIKMLLEMKR